MFRNRSLNVFTQGLKQADTKTNIYFNIQRSLASNENELKRENSNEIEINPKYENRNPRNLDWSGHQYKRFGWNLQFPPKNFYHQVTFKVLDTKIEATVEHASGRRVIQLTTIDPVIRQFLYTPRDHCAAANLGRVVADRCLQYGIDQLKYLVHPSAIDSAKEPLFREALIKAGLKLEEPEFIEKADSSLGLDYDNLDFFHERRDVPFPPKMNAIIREKLKQKYKIDENTKE